MRLILGLMSGLIGKHIRKPHTLLVSTSVDPASVVMSEALIQIESIDAIEEIAPRIYRSKGDFQQDFFLWKQDTPLLQLNNVDEAFRQELQKYYSEDFIIPLSDVIFLSKHSAASGKPSLTVHPIGVPWTLDISRMGGFPGRCSPPNARISSLYRSLIQRVSESDLKDEFEVSLEATHHGPHCDVPACFVEIGSTEKDWDRSDAGALWADLLINHFKNEKEHMNISTNAKAAVMVIGGGHYCPKTGDIARAMGDEIVLGHTLASYTLHPYFDGSIEQENAVDGGWQAVVKEAVSATKIAFPSIPLVVLVDKKAFKSEPRNALVNFLESEGVQWTYKLKITDIIKKEEDTIV